MSNPKNRPGYQRTGFPHSPFGFRPGESESPESDTPETPRERAPSNEPQFAELLEANARTYRRNTAVAAIEHYMKHWPESIPYFEAALAEADFDDISRELACRGRQR